MNAKLKQNNYYSTFIFILFFTAFSAKIEAQKNYKILPDTLITTNMKRDTLDIEYFEKNQKDDDLTILKNDGTNIRQFKSGFHDGYVEYFIPPLPKLYRIYKEYYKNGKLKIFGYRLYPGIRISKWYYYDEKGKETIVDEDLKFGKFDYNKVVQMLAKMGYVNLQTGQGRERLQFGYDKEKKLWIIHVLQKEDNSEMGRLLHIDGNSGKIKKSEPWSYY